MKKITLLLLFVAVVSGQYTSKDYVLIKTTFLREFSRETINQYLESGDDHNVNAALLSIAQSEDTSFVPQIIKLNFKKFGSAIAFALGELGECKASSDYLIEKLQEDNNTHSLAFYEALGKIGTNQDLIDCIDIHRTTNNDGFPLAVFNFHAQGIVDTNQVDVNILLKNLKITDNKEKLFRSLFALYRVAPDKVNPRDLELILKGNFDPAIKTYALGILRKNESFPYSFDLANNLIFNDDWTVRCEAARTVCYYPYKTAEEANLYLNFLFDGNPNVARTAAQSLGNINIEDTVLVNKYLSAIEKVLNDDLTANVKGEILLSLQNYYPNDTEELIETHENDVGKSYIWQLLGNYTYDPYYAFNKLKEDYESADDYDKFLINSNLSNLYDSLKTDEEFSNFILEQYNSDSPLSITLYNYVIDSSFVVNNSAKLKDKIDKLANSKISDSDYNQAISSFFNFTDYIDSNLSKSLLQKISESTNYDLQYDLRDEIELSEAAKQYREKLFNKLFKNAFKYSKAIIKTEKGDFVIEFTPDVAPISVGSFIYLAENDFYENIIFHRVVPNFVIQTGDPSGTGWGGPAYTIVSEFSSQPFDTYYVGMASAGKDTEGSQWFVMQNDYPHLNGNYTNFGKVIDGFDVVNSVDQYDVVKDIELIK